jgi:hypothetical protein
LLLQLRLQLLLSLSPRVEVTVHIPPSRTKGVGQNVVGNMMMGGLKVKAQTKARADFSIRKATCSGAFPDALVLQLRNNDSAGAWHSKHFDATRLNSNGMVSVDALLLWIDQIIGHEQCCGRQRIRPFLSSSSSFAKAASVVVGGSETNSAPFLFLL